MANTSGIRCTAGLRKLSLRRVFHGRSCEARMTNEWLERFARSGCCSRIRPGVNRELLTCRTFLDSLSDMKTCRLSARIDETTRKKLAERALMEIRDESEI